MFLRRLLGPNSYLRSVIDVGWIVGFGVVMTLMIVGQGSAGRAVDGSVKLTLEPTEQLRGLYRGSLRLGEIHHRVERAGAGWRVVQRFFATVPKRVELGWSRVVLRSDLSMDRIAVRLEPAKLAGLMGMAPQLAARLKASTMRINGSCRVETGRCQVNGVVGERVIDQHLTAGRGPVLPTAILPLLVKGVLGRKAELGIFNPLTMERQVVTYRVLERGRVTLPGGEVAAVRIKQNVQGFDTELWVDERGRLLSEELPLGVTIRHDAWHIADEGAKKP